MPPDAQPEAPSLADKVAFLSALPGVDEVIETHMAFVFLTKDRVLKLKKPVRIGYSDCRTTDRRERAVAKEIWLNRDLAPGVYLGRLPLHATARGLSLQDAGPVCDWLVRMRRLPQSLMLDRMIGQGLMSDPGRIEALGAALAAFYLRQARRRPPRHIYAMHLDREAGINALHLRELSAHLPRPGTVRIAEEVRRRLRVLHPEILARDRGGMVLEGHGDLRPEHVCLSDPPVIFDRAEAALELRAIDVWDECMSLAVECAMMGHVGIGGQLTDALLAAGFAPPSPQLMLALIRFRLVTRARLSLDHLRDDVPSDREDWPERAQRYLDAAESLSCGDGEGTGRGMAADWLSVIGPDWGSPSRPQ